MKTKTQNLSNAIAWHLQHSQEAYQNLENSYLNNKQGLENEFFSVIQTAGISDQPKFCHFFIV